jgi:hypothetical protein
MAPMILVVDIGMLHMIPEQKTKKPRKITKQVGGMVCVTNGKRPKKVWCPSKTQKIQTQYAVNVHFNQQKQPKTNIRQKSVILLKTKKVVSPQM